MTPEQADILLETQGLAGVEGVYAMVPRTAAERARLPATVVVLDQPDAYTLAAVTCALIRAMPDRDRFHVGVSTASRFHAVFDLEPLQLARVDREQATARAAVRPRAPEIQVPDLPSIDELTLELIWMIGTDRVYPLEIVIDPFRSLDPAMPIIVTCAYLARERRHAWQAESVEMAMERLTWAKPRWIACDADLAIGEHGLLDALSVAHPELLERTMVVATEVSAEWMRKLIGRRHESVRVVVRSPLFGVED